MLQKFIIDKDFSAKDCPKCIAVLVLFYDMNSSFYLVSGIWYITLNVERVGLQLGLCKCRSEFNACFMDES